MFTFYNVIELIIEKKSQILTGNFLGNWFILYFKTADQNIYI